MANINTINIGNLVNDGLGDDLRTAFQKVNANFAALNAELTVTASNVGIGEGIFRQKNGNNLEFKTLSSGNKIQLDSRLDTIIVNSTQPDAFVRIDTNNGFVSAANNINITMQGGDNITVSGSGSTITIDTSLPLVDIFSSADFGWINPNQLQNNMQFIYQVANIDFGTFNNPSTLALDFGPFV